MNIQQLTSKHAILGDRIQSAKKSVIQTDKLIREEEAKLTDISEAIEIVTAVLSITQGEIVSFIEEIVTLALQYVYGDEYEFMIEFELKRGQPEVVLSPMRAGMKYDPKFSCGVGVIDVCAFALRCACWAIAHPQTAPVLVFDEPFKSISGMEQLERVEQMVKEISKMLNIQVIIVSGKYPQSDYADKVIEVALKGGISKVQEV